MVPKGTPKDAIDHWSAVFKKATEDQSVLAQMKAKGTGVEYVGPAGYRKWFEETFADHEKVAIKIGMYKK